MADDFDVEAMLEAPYRQDGDQNGQSNSRSKDKHKKKRSRSRDRERDRRRDRSRSRHRSRDRIRRSNSREPKRSKDRVDRKDRRDRRSRSKGRERERKSPIRPSPVKERPRSPELTPEERDARTVFCMQLAARLRPRDLEEFFSSVGKVKDVRIIMDNKTRRSKGIAYVEFGDVESVALAIGLNGQRLLGVPIIIQHSQAEKNRQASMMSSIPAAANLGMMGGKSGPMRLYVGSLHFNITEDMLRAVFEPFGRILDITLIKDSDTGTSKGFGFLTFSNSDDAKKALEQLNGFELAGRPMKVGNVTERQGTETTFFDHDEVDRAGFDLGATGRLQLMAKLAEGTGFNLPKAAASALNGATGTLGFTGNTSPGLNSTGTIGGAPPIATQCFMLSNLFDPSTESAPTWDTEIRDDVLEECNKNGGAVHIYVDKASPQGNVYVKCPSIASAVAAVNSLHGRYFAGRIITAAYVPLPNYHQLFPDAIRTNMLLLPTGKSYPAPYGN